MSIPLNRRRFIRTASSAGAITIVARSALGGKGFVSANDKITMAHIGMGTQGFSELGTLLEDPNIQIVAVCDPNKDSNDYVEWGKGGIRKKISEYLNKPSWRQGMKGCPGGRDVGREVVETYYANHRGKESFKGCAAYADFRELLENEKDIDAVKIMTPDHLHATISIAAMKQGLHVLMHKPIANRMYEGRLVLETARKYDRRTHLLAYGSGSKNEMIAQKIKQGAIGTLREIHNWTNRPVWPQYSEIPTERPPVPAGFDWELWLGPEKERHYHPHYTHTVFRGWYDFGGGSMADMGIYSLWPVFTALNFEAAESAQAWQTHTCFIDDNVSKKRKNDFAFPTACTLRFRFAAKGDAPGLELFWYDGGMKPRLPQEIEQHDIALEREGILFIGDDGMILADFRGDAPSIYRQAKIEPLVLDEAADQATNRLSRWIDACRGGKPSPGDFLNAASITDTVNLGAVALRAETKVQFDSKTMKITNESSANQYLYREYRKGWEL